MRRLLQVLVYLAVMALGFALPGVAPAGPGLERRPVEFTLENPHESGAARQIVGYRYDPPCPASTVVLLQHGLAYTKEAWDFPGYSVAQPLARAGYAVVAIDRLGYAESVLEDGNKTSSEAYADMTRQMVDQLREEFDHVVTGGHSAGAEVTELEAGLFGGVDAIMALGYHHRPSDELVEQFMGREVPRSFGDDYVYWLGTPENWGEWNYSSTAARAVVDATTDAVVLTPSGEIQSIGKQPSGKVLPLIDVPVFLQFSGADRLFEVKYAEWEKMQFASSPSVTVDVVPQAGHTFMLHPTGPAGTERMVAWLRSRAEAPACS